MIIDEIAKEFSKLDYVDAVVLSGSQTGLINDEKSDYDIYVYSTKPIPLEFRKKLAEKYTSDFTVGNTFFEDGDEYSVENPKVGIDIMYRQLDWSKSEIDWVWKKHNAKVGFTTALLHNLRTSKILYDKNGEFQKIIDELNMTFPEALKQNIIAKNYPLLREKSASFYDQIKLAIQRNDLISLNHRVTALLTSYFDILFAINNQTHPGEKKLVKYSEKLCTILPRDFQNDMKRVILSIGTENLIPSLDKLLDELDKIL